MLKDLIKSILSYFEALGFLSAHNLWRYALYSGAIGLVISMVILGLATLSFNFLSDWLQGLLPENIAMLGAIGGVISGILIIILFFILFKYLILALTGPLMSRLSLEVETIVSTQLPQERFNIAQGFSRGIRLSVRNLFKELFYTAIFTLISVLTGVGFITYPLIYLLQSFFAGMGNFDYWAERRFSFSETINFSNHHRGLLLGNGAIFMFLLAIPILGVFIAPPLATVAMTLTCEDQDYSEDQMV